MDSQLGWGQLGRASLAPGARTPPGIAQCLTTSLWWLGSLWCLLTCAGLDQADGGESPVS